MSDPRVQQLTAVNEQLQDELMLLRDELTIAKAALNDVAMDNRPHPMAEWDQIKSWYNRRAANAVQAMGKLRGGA